MVHGALSAADPETARSMYTAISELGTNVPEHSGREGGFLAAQLTHNQSRVRFAVGDAGSGLLAKMRTVGATNDIDAARLALQNRVTDTGVVHRGKGLAAVLRLVTRAHGSLYVGSGTGGLVVDRHHARTQMFSYRLRGTVIQGTLPCGRRS
jgi:anti-sigma regulatory factor (Ser/Thr protein kinase)